MSVRTLNDTLKASLISEDPFLYAHLVKFERIVKTVSSKPSKTATDYSYITDAATNISYNDGSSDVHENLNGAQTYIANRLLKVGSVNETTEAKASSLTIDIASIALDTKVEGQVLDFIGNVNADTVQINLDSTSTGYEDDFVERGFTEGDKVTITHKDGTNTDLHNRQCIITSFASNNKTMHCTTILGSDGIQSIASTPLHNTSDYTLTLSTDEVVGALNDPDDTTYAAYINREVFIYKTHIDPDTNATIGDPYLIFKGIIAKVKLSEDPSKSSTVKWTLTSHWGDFDRVNGRITSDEEHRALGVNRRPDTASLHRNEYAYDFGFKHSEQAINIISIYQVMETRYKMKKSGWIFKKYKMKEYEVEVDKDVDLRFNLHAKHLPVLYGVNKTDSIPIFADTLKNDPSKIYVVYAICEGEVSGIYDMYIDDQSRICIDKNDSDTRSTQTAEDTIDVVCEGRMDRGDTLSSAPAFTSAITDFLSDYSYNWDGRGVGGIGAVDWRSLGINLAANFTQNGDTGVTHEKQNTFEFPIKAKAIFHAGRSHQRSDDMLTRIGTEKVGGNIVGGFKLQQDMEDEDKTSYWDSNFRLLDTAYLAVEYEIAEGDVTIPEIDFVVRGREVQQYNYDYSYREMSPPSYGSAASAANRAKFKIGDFVDVYESATNNPALAQNIQIVDLYKYVDAREEEYWKFRFASNPLTKADGTTSSTTNFYMVPDGTASSSNDRFHFATWDDKAVSGDVGATLRHAIDTNASNTATGTVAANSGGTGINITDLSTTLQKAIEYLSATGGVTIGFSNSIVNFTAEDLIAQITSFQLDSSKVSDDGIEDLGTGTENIDEPDFLFTTNAVTLTGTVSAVDDYYNGQIIKITRKNIDGTIKVQTRRIIGYEASEKRVYVGDFSPVETTNTAVTTSTTYKVKTAVKNGKVVEFQPGTNMSGLAVGDVLQPNANVRFPLGTSIASIVGTVVTFSDEGWVSNFTDLTFYRGADDTATVVEPKPWDFIPFDDTDSPSGIADTFEIIPEGDKKVSINPAVQLLDYLTNERFGRGLDINDDTHLETFKQAARLCDTRSDVTLILPNATYANDAAWNNAVTNADKWKLVTTHSGTDYFQWQGTIKSISKNADGTVLNSAGTGYVEVTFEDCIGKLIHKWFDWKSYEIGQVVYHRASNLNKIYLVTAAGTLTEPAGGHASSLTLQLSTNSSTTAVVHLASPTNAALNETGSTWDRNPVIKKYNTTEDTYSTSGYSLYDSDDVKYWRYMGWQSQDQREVTRHQTNATIRTETPLFQNVNAFLGHFNGILRYSNGKYELDVESAAPTINTVTLGGTSYTDPRIITADDIIGAINIDDAGLKGSANSVSVSIPDPQIRFDNRNVTFYKSEYLKEDRGIPKKKSVKNPFITNYFNARINAEQYLDQSRFSRKINFQIGPKGLLLLAGTIIKITYPRFNWNEKLFRISNLQIKEDCLVQVTAEEHDDNSYIVEGKDKDIFGIGSATGSSTPEPPPTGKPVAGSLTATTDLQGKIKLSWANNINFLPSDWSTEIWYNNNSSFTGGDNASKLVSGLKDTEYEHNLQDITETTSYYYWTRHVKDVVRGKSNTKTPIPSFFEPLNSTSGIQGTASALAGLSSNIIYLYKVVDQGAAAPTIQATFPTVTVTMDGGEQHGKITSIPSGQGSAALGGTFPNHTITDTNGAATGWQTFLPSLAGVENTWLTAATKNTVSDSDDIPRNEWASPIRFSGSHGESSTVLSLFKTTSTTTAPSMPTGDSTYNFNTKALSTTNLNDWSVTQPATNTTSAKYLWKTTGTALAVTAVTGDTIDTIPSSEWSTPPVNIHINPADGTDGSSGGAGPSGDSGPRASNFIIYHSAGSASSPGNPTASLYTFANNTFTWTNTTGWSTSAPIAVAGTTTSNYWYATVNAQEGIDSNGDGTGNTSGTGGVLTISNAYIGLGFTGLVTFTALTTSGSTQIHGANITTGTINANRISLSGHTTSELTPNSGWTDDTAADAAQADADAAQADADAATSTLADIADDDKLTPSEKQQAKTLWDAVATEYAGIVASAATLSAVSSSDYTTAYNSLNAYLNTSPDVFDDMDATTTIARTTWNARWEAYYDKKQALLDAIAAALKTIADDAYNLAGGKNKTFYQTTAPTSGMIEGDLWVDSDATDVSAKYWRWAAAGSGNWITINPATVGGWNLTAGALYSGTQVTNISQGFASSTGNLGHITINSGGSIHTPFFYSNPGGAGFKGTLTVNDGGSDTTLDLSNSTAFNTYIGGKAPIQSVTVGGSAATISNGVLQLAASTGDSLSDTTVGAGYIVLRTAYTGQSDGAIEFDTGTPSTAQKTNAIVLETSASTNKITIYDGTTARVIIGKLS